MLRATLAAFPESAALSNKQTPKVSTAEAVTKKSTTTVPTVLSIVTNSINRIKYQEHQQQHYKYSLQPLP